MGVKNLWQLLEPASAKLNDKDGGLSGAHGKVLAVDISIWLQQIVKGMRDSKGDQVPNSHLIGLFSRISKLLYYDIRPIFVFDGGAPAIKQLTLEKRRRVRDVGTRDLKQARQRLLENKLRRYALGDVNALSSRSRDVHKDPIADLFSIPETRAKPGENNKKRKKKPTANSQQQHKVTQDPVAIAVGGDDVNDNDDDVGDGEIIILSDSDDDLDNGGASLDEQNAADSWAYDTHNLDITSADFLALPYEIQHEILIEKQESDKNKSSRKGGVSRARDRDLFSQNQVISVPIGDSLENLKI